MRLEIYLITSMVAVSAHAMDGSDGYYEPSPLPEAAAPEPAPLTMSGFSAEMPLQSNVDIRAPQFNASPSVPTFGSRVSPTAQAFPEPPVPPSVVPAARTSNGFLAGGGNINADTPNPLSDAGPSSPSSAASAAHPSPTPADDSWLHRVAVYLGLANDPNSPTSSEGGFGNMFAKLFDSGSNNTMTTAQGPNLGESSVAQLLGASNAKAQGQIIRGTNGGVNGAWVRQDQAAAYVANHQANAAKTQTATGNQPTQLTLFANQVPANNTAAATLAQQRGLGAAGGSQ